MAVAVSIDDGVATVTIDNPPVNTTSQAVRQGLLDAVAKTEAEMGVTGVILACAGKTFIAGADVTEFGKPPLEPHLPDVIDAIEATTKPWVAALHGTVLGGGLEVAMGCHARIAAPGTKMGLPEVALGLIPGAGGTVRLPRLIAASNALTMITSGKPVPATTALEYGLIDVMAETDLLAEAHRLLATSDTNRTMARAIGAYDHQAFADLSKQTIAKARGQQSIVEAAVAVERALTLPVAEARAAEREAFLRLKTSDQSVALRHLFFAERKTLTDPRTKTPARPIDRIGVIGGGTMGAGIATACLMRGLTVTLVEQSEERANAARDTITTNLEASAKRGIVKDPEAVLERLTTGDSYAILNPADLVIEAVFEDMDVKQEVFRQIEAATRAETIIATNTSYLDINQIAGVLKDPSRAIGLHFFSPAHIMKLLEIVVPTETADDVIATAAALAKRLGKIGVLAGVCDGFIGNRIMSAYRHEADILLEEGAMPEQVDSAMRSFGFAIGIFQMQDLAGLDIAWAMRKRRTAETGMPENYVHIADRLCEAERFGHKTKAGWYDYGPDGVTSSEFVANVINAERDRKGVTPRAFSADEIMQRILGRMKREADATIQEGIALHAADIDVVMVNGYGFPRWRGGPSLC